MPIERETVVWGYRFLLGRNPESEEVILRQQQHEDLAAFRKELINSLEFRAKFEPVKEDITDISIEYGRECLVFLHVPKTAGTTLHHLLLPHFAADRVCPERFNLLHAYPPAALSRYDYYSGHFDVFSLRCIPRANMNVISFFRKPRDRLISMYYFFRLHPVEGAAASRERLIVLANQLGIEEFFECPEVRNSSSVWNTYALTYGANVCCGKWENALGHAEGKFVDAEALLAEALARIGNLFGIGIVEHFNASVEKLFRLLGFPLPPEITSRQVTDTLPNEIPALRCVKREPITRRLERALDDLVVLDELIYSEALAIWQWL